MEQWLQKIDVVESSDHIFRVTKISRRERRNRMMEKNHDKSAVNNGQKIYLYKRFRVEKGCSGGCGHDVLMSSFFPKWNRGVWNCVGSISKNEVLTYDSVINAQTTCCGGFERYENFRIIVSSPVRTDHNLKFGYGTKKNKTLEITYDRAVSLSSKKN